MENVLYYCVIGLVVSMDAMALTLSKRSTYEDPWPTLTSWAALNAAWHSGLLIVYVFAFHYGVEYFKWLLDGIDLTWIELTLPSFLFPKEVVWFIAKLKLHVLSIFSAIAMIMVWTTYSTKIIDRPTLPDPAGLSFWLRPFFRLLNRALSNNAFNLNLQAALVAVDMLALAALMKASDQTGSTTDKIIMTIVVAASVFLLTLGSIAFARVKLSESPQADATGDAPSQAGRDTAKKWILITLRLLEPLLIFYFLIQLLATMATGMQVESLPLLFAAVIMVVAIVQMHGLARICDAALATER